MTTPTKKACLSATLLLALGGAALYGHAGWAAAQTAASAAPTMPAFDAA